MWLWRCEVCGVMVSQPDCFDSVALVLTFALSFGRGLKAGWAKRTAAWPLLYEAAVCSAPASSTTH
eukprot:209321-Chlamydomonas_euryale.AAC.12